MRASRRHPDAGKHPGTEPLPRRQDRPCAASDEGGEYYFLPRPRRFGKSLRVDTPKKLSEGNGELFRGPAIRSEWDWTVRHPVVRISFGGRTFTVPGHPDTNLDAQLGKTERDAGIERLHREAPERFAHLIRSLHAIRGNGWLCLPTSTTSRSRTRLRNRTWRLRTGISPIVA